MRFPEIPRSQEMCIREVPSLGSLLMVARGSISFLGSGWTFEPSLLLLISSPIWPSALPTLSFHSHRAELPFKHFPLLLKPFSSVSNFIPEFHSLPPLLPTSPHPLICLPLQGSVDPSLTILFPNYSSQCVDLPRTSINQSVNPIPDSSFRERRKDLDRRPPDPSRLTRFAFDTLCHHLPPAPFTTTSPLARQSRWGKWRGRQHLGHKMLFIILGTLLPAEHGWAIYCGEMLDVSALFRRIRVVRAIIHYVISADHVMGPATPGMYYIQWCLLYSFLKSPRTKHRLRLGQATVVFPLISPSHLRKQAVDPSHSFLEWRGMLICIFFSFLEAFWDVHFHREGELCISRQSPSFSFSQLSGLHLSHPGTGMSLMHFSFIYQINLCILHLDSSSSFFGETFNLIK